MGDGNQHFNAILSPVSECFSRSFTRSYAYLKWLRRSASFAMYTQIIKCSYARVSFNFAVIENSRHLISACGRRVVAAVVEAHYRQATGDGPLEKGRSRKELSSFCCAVPSSNLPQTFSKPTSRGRGTGRSPFRGSRTAMVRP